MQMHPIVANSSYHPHANWRRFVLMLAGRIIKKSVEPLTDGKRKNVLILDDSLFSRSCSKKVEPQAAGKDLRPRQPGLHIRVPNAYAGLVRREYVSAVNPRYILLAVEQRENRDMRSLGELFYLSADELPDIRYMEALRLILSKFAELIQ